MNLPFSWKQGGYRRKVKYQQQYYWVSPKAGTARHTIHTLSYLILIIVTCLMCFIVPFNDNTYDVLLIVYMCLYPQLDYRHHENRILFSFFPLLGVITLTFSMISSTQNAQKISVDWINRYLKKSRKSSLKCGS